MDKSLIFQTRPAHPSDSHGMDMLFTELNWFVPIGTPVDSHSEAAFEVKARMEKIITLAQNTDLKCFFVAENYAADLIGYSSAYILPKTDDEYPEIYLTDLYVAKKHRNHGVGQALLDEIVAVAQTHGSREILLHANHTLSHHGFYGNRSWEEDIDQGIFVLRI